jgi:DNA-binding response OmpR family regulator
VPTPRAGPGHLCGFSAGPLGGLYGSDVTPTRPRIPRAAAAILICEDEVALRELMRVSLGAGYRYLEAEDGREALRLARAQLPDVIVLDLMLPGLGGLDVLRELRRDPVTAATRVVAISAWSDVEADALAAGANLFLPKPFVPEEFRARVEELLRSG